VLGAAAPDRAAAQLPDLVPEVYGIAVQVQNVPQGDVIEGCAGGTTGRRLIRFGLRTRNIGAGDLVLGNPGCPDCATHPGASCTNPLFVCSPAHGHVHFEHFAHAELLDGNGMVIVEGHKDGFCLLDSECPTLNYSCSNQGLTAGCADVYTPQTPCQYIDVTDTPLPPGTYTLRVMIDPDGTITEADETNNTTTAVVEIGTGPPTPTPVVTPQPLCLAAPRSPCYAPRTSQVRMRDPAGDNSDRIAWSWLRGQTTKAAFGNPLTVTRYALCLYDESQPSPALVASAQVAAQGLCGRRPCWRAVGTQGFTYVDGRGTSDGVVRIQLKRGPRGEGRIVVRAKGPALSLPALPITPYGGIRAQLVNSDGECWEATYDPPALRNTSVDFKEVAP
jgi:hypothetical protein